jgi:mRNA interferase RelE/StbE
LKLEFKRSAERDLRSITPRLIPNILSRIERLADEPYPRQATKLAGTEGLYRLRVGDYRVVYEVDGERQVVSVAYIRHRRDVYRRL